jgi:hypothetical protein
MGNASDSNNNASDTPNSPNDPSLNEKLQSYYDAIKSEFDASNPDNPMNREIVRSQLLTKLPVALQSIIFLAEYADSESVRLNASKFIYKEVLNPDGALGDDEIQTLLKELTHSK